MKKINRHQRVVVQDRETRCLFCGCTDSNACGQGCAWLVRSKAKDWGICSGCERQMQELDERLHRAMSITYFAHSPAMRHRP